MARPTADQLLEALDTAILAILNGNAVVSYAIGDRRVQRASLAELRDLRRDIAAGRVPTGGLRTYVELPGTDQGSGWDA